MSYFAHCNGCGKDTEWKGGRCSVCYHIYVHSPDNPVGSICSTCEKFYPLSDLELVRPVYPDAKDYWQCRKCGEPDPEKELWFQERPNATEEEIEARWGE